MIVVYGVHHWQPQHITGAAHASCQEQSNNIQEVYIHTTLTVYGVLTEFEHKGDTFVTETNLL
jgi:hypothetical protein